MDTSELGKRAAAWARRHAAATTKARETILNRGAFMTLMGGWRESLSEIARHVGLTRRHAARTIKELEDEGVLRIVRRQELGRGHVANVIEIPGIDPSDIGGIDPSDIEPTLVTYPSDIPSDPLVTPIYEDYEGNESQTSSTRNPDETEPAPPVQRLGGADRAPSEVPGDGLDALQRYVARQVAKDRAALGARAAKVIDFPKRGKAMTNKQRADHAMRSLALELQLEARIPVVDILDGELETMTREELERIVPLESLEQEPARSALELADLLEQRNMTPEQRTVLAESGHVFDAERNAAAICKLLDRLELAA